MSRFITTAAASFVGTAVLILASVPHGFSLIA